MIKVSLKKVFGIVLAASVLLSSAAFAAPAAMTVNIPSESITKLELPSDMTELVNSLNGVDAEGNSITDAEGNQIKSNDICGWKLESRGDIDVFSQDGSYLRFGSSGAAGQLFRLSNGESLNVFGSPFNLNCILKYYSGGFDIYIGKVKDFNDSEDDYYRITGEFQSTPWGTKITLRRVKTGEETIAATGDLSGNMGINGSIKYDGSKVSVYNGSTEIASINVTDPVSEGKVYLHAQGSRNIAVRSIELAKPVAKKSNEDFYLGLTGLKTDDANIAAFTEAGWYLNHDMTVSADGNLGEGLYYNGHNTYIRYENAEFSGDYTVKARANVSYNNLYVKFNYKDSGNYYAFKTGSGAADAESNLYLVKCVDGEEVTLNTVTYTGYFLNQTLKFNVENEDDGSVTISLKSPNQFTYTDDGTENGTPFTSGKIMINDSWGGFLRVTELHVYPTANEETDFDAITFNFHVNGAKAAGETIPKGVTEISMPRKYAGIRNKIVVALYDNHAMQQVKVYNAMDFCINDTLEAFDTTNCSSDAQIGVFMWNSLDSIRPLMSETFVRVQ